MQNYTKTGKYRERERGGLASVVYYKCADDTRHPPAQCQQEDDEDGAAALVNDCQGRAEDADENSQDTHFDLRFAISKLKKNQYVCHLLPAQKPYLTSDSDGRSP